VQRRTPGRVAEGPCSASPDTLMYSPRDVSLDTYGLVPSRPAPVPPSTPPMVPMHAEQSGAGQRPAPGAPKSIVRRGYVSVKEDGLRSWIWSKRWLVLRETTLTMHKNEVGILARRLTPAGDTTGNQHRLAKGCGEREPHRSQALLH